MEIGEQLKSALRDRYRIEREIGSGGMATVYLAEDVRHERFVALKVLNPELGAVLGIERFLAEIKVTANLQHPNLLPLFDSGEANGLLFYVMPFVAGESLRARLSREKQLPVAEAVHIAISVAGALDYAHGHGVVHRDLKPENILLQAGEPLIADFGIALAVSNAGGARITQTGISLGTPQYMSPEQATGDRAVDRRSDVYSLGAVLYEMLSGDPPHTGSTAQAIIAKVITDRPRSLRAFRDSVPEYIAEAVEASLAKLPADRFATAAEFSQALAGRSVAIPTGALGAAKRRTYLRDPRTWVAAAAILVAALALPARWLTSARDTTEAPQVRAAILPPPGEDFAGGDGIALSSDGTMLAFTVLRAAPRPSLFVRPLSSDVARELPGTAGARFPFWSPDGKQLGYFANGQLHVIGVDGRGATALGRAANPLGGAWGPDGTILFAGDPGGLIYRVRPNAEPVAVTKRGSEGPHTLPRLLPDGHHFLFSGFAHSGIFVGDLRGGTQRRLSNAGSASYAGQGQLIVDITPANQAAVLAAIAFDPSRAELRGEPTILADSVFNPGAFPGYSVSATGVLVFQRAPTNHVRVWIDRHGKELDTISRDSAWTYRLSHDGRFVAQAGYVLSVRDLRRGVTLQLPTEGFRQGAITLWPAWSPDDARVAFFQGSSSQNFTLRIMRADGTGERVDLGPAGMHPLDWTKDGESLLAIAPASTTNPDLAVWLFSTTSKTQPAKPWLEVGGDIPEARLSPDGRWVAYQSDENGLPEIYVRPFPGAGPPVRVSLAGGGRPAWRSDGRELYYLTPAGDLAAVSVSTGARFAAGKPQVLIRGVTRQPFSLAVTPYDAAPDGQRFLVYTENRAATPPLTLVAPWQRSLPRK